MTLIVDSFAWVEVLAGGPLGRVASQRMGAAGQLLTPDIVLRELAGKFSRNGLSGEDVRVLLESVLALSEVVPITTEIAVASVEADKDLRTSARTRRLNRPGLADALVLAVARVHGGTVLTGDPHFRGLAETDWLDD